MTVDIKALRELLARATPGPWTVSIGDVCDRDTVMGIYGPDTTEDYGMGPERCRHRIVETDCGVYDPRMPDAALIVAAVNALPQLLDEVGRLRAALDETASCPRCGRPDLTVGTLNKHRPSCMSRTDEEYEIDELTAEVERLRAALVDAADLAEEGWGYAGDYFNEKWDAPRQIAELRALTSPDGTGGRP